MDRAKELCVSARARRIVPRRARSAASAAHANASVPQKSMSYGAAGTVLYPRTLHTWRSTPQTPSTEAQRRIVCICGGKARPFTPRPWMHPAAWRLFSVKPLRMPQVRTSLSTTDRPLAGLFGIAKPSGPTSMDILDQLKPLLASSSLFYAKDAPAQEKPRRMKPWERALLKRCGRMPPKMGQGGTLDPLAEGVLGRCKNNAALTQSLA